MTRAFEIWDIFTQTRYCGNPLAVVYDAQGLTTTQMQTLAREFNLSETTFILPPENKNHTNRVRIFTPEFEMPFAGHPTVGTALSIARKRNLSGTLTLELNAGLFHVELSNLEGMAYAAFTSPNQPVETGPTPDVVALARALSLSPDDFDQAAHKPRRCGAGGVNYIYLRASGDAVRRAALNNTCWEGLGLKDTIGLYLYTDQIDSSPVSTGNTWHARMFAPSAGVPEDPATGSAATSFPAQLALAALADGKALSDGSHKLFIEQGYEMGRPSQIHADIEVANGAIAKVIIGGHGVPVASGILEPAS